MNIDDFVDKNSDVRNLISPTVEMTSIALAISPAGTAKPATHPGGTKNRSKWPVLDPERIAALTTAGLTLDGLRELSPVKSGELPPDAETVIDILFPGNPLLCVGWSWNKFGTRTREKWRGELSAMQLLVPSPMTAVWGKTQKGTRSQHTLNNTGPRRFLVVEFDGASVDHQAALLVHLATLAPLVMALHSGGKSIHGWFLRAGRDEQHIEHFFRYAVSLGADPATWSRCQFVRMPNGVRANGRPQPVLYLNPALLLEAR
jgi:hypothetical protein